MYEENIKDAQDQQGVTLTCDRWRNVAKQEIFGIVLINSQGKSIIWDAQDISDEQPYTSNIINKLEALIDMGNIVKHHVKVIAVVTDSASAYAAAWTQLRRKRPEIIWLLCFAYQLNLCIVDILKAFVSLDLCLKHAIKVIESFNHSPYLLKNLRDRLVEAGKYGIALEQPCTTRWNSYFDVLISPQKTKHSLRVFYLNVL